MKRLLVSVLGLALLAGVFCAGSWYGHRHSRSGEGGGGPRILYYVDPMNPAHTSDQPGLAPCGMKMEPVYADQAADAAQIRLGQHLGRACDPDCCR